MLKEIGTKDLTFTVDLIIEPDEPGFHAYCPALKGLHVGGDTLEETLQNAQDAAELYIESLIRHGDAIPLGANPEHLKHIKEKKGVQHKSVKVVVKKE